MRGDVSFEDREGHQAPFTLLVEENVQRSTSNAEWQNTEKDCDLFELFDLTNDLVEIGPIARLKFGMKQLAIGMDFKRAAARRDKLERFDAIPQFENFRRQTDGLRRVVSNHAIFDRHFGFHRALLSMEKRYGARATRSSNRATFQFKARQSPIWQKP